MPIKFQITQRLAGFAASATKGGEEQVSVIYRELVAPTEPSHFLERVEHLQNILFNMIPGLPPPSVIDHLLILVRPDLSGVAYVNELNITAMIKPTRSIKKGEAIYASEIEDISTINLGVEIPEDAAVVLIRSNNWRRSLFFDFGPIFDKPIPRDYSLERTFAEQALLLLGLAVHEGEDASPAGKTRLFHMKSGLSRLEYLLADGCEDEGKYQRLLMEHSWMFGGIYDRVERHKKLDDQRIPDFTGRRCYDSAHDVIEIKQPFLSLFRKKGSFSANFNDSWNQAEAYLMFTQQQRSYLREEKGLQFENPRCLLLLGHGLTGQQRKAIREKEILARSITVWTYNELLRIAQHIVNLMETATERVAAEAEVSESIKN